DAFDFFIFVFCLRAISAEFHTGVKAVAEGIFLTLACRPLGALVFGWLAERYGRRPILMLNVASYSAVQLLTAFAPDLTTLLALYIRFGVAESPAWVAGVSPQRASAAAVWRAAKNNFATLGYLVLLMACFNAFSHGSQDLYPTFLQAQHGFATAVTGHIAIVMNLGALAGGICFGALSERFGRRRTIVAATALALPMIPLWAFSHTAVMLALGGFLM